jgi:cell division protease FtsH
MKDIKDTNNKQNSNKNKKKFNDKDKKSIFIWIIVAVLVFYFFNISNMMAGSSKKLNYGDFYKYVETGYVKKAVKAGNIISGQLKDGSQFKVYVADNDKELIKVLRDNVTFFDVQPPKTFLVNLVYSMLPMFIFIAFLWFFVYRNMASGGGKVFSFGKSKAKLAKNTGGITFKDVAGVEEAKEELQEIIDYLKHPKKFQRLGGKIPKGVLLMGPPGTGKTLLAKAVAGEANVPFYNISGSDFVEMFVGVGASRVRDLFEQAKKSSISSEKGSIIFIDEIDAVGRQRFSGIGGGHDEREQTLNALLVEMDGFDTKEGVILIAATNRPDVLDPALLRPGRFDRQVVIDRPDIIGREAILKVHVKNIKLSKDVDLKIIARQTPGFSGADIANLVNEAALLAARLGEKEVNMKELEASIERVLAGLERKSRVIGDDEKEIVSYHESGHAILAYLIEEVDPLHKVSIIPRGVAALGYTMQLPEKDKYLKSKKEFLGEITVLLGGRVSENLKFNEFTTGSQNDIERATELAHRMVCVYGMSENLGNLTFGRRDKEVFLGRDMLRDRDYSEETAVKIDKEVRRIVDECYERAVSLLKEHWGSLDKLAKVLLEHEVVTLDIVKKVLNGEHIEPKIKEQNPETKEQNKEESEPIKEPVEQKENLAKDIKDSSKQIDETEVEKNEDSEEQEFEKDKEQSSEENIQEEDKKTEDNGQE